MSRSADQVNALGERIEEAAGVDPAATGRRERIEITKTAIREVLREWLDDRIRDVGKWSLRGMALLVFGALLYFILTHTGWQRQ
jgi:hypothetical protein